MKKLQSTEIKPTGVNVAVKIEQAEKVINGVKMGRELASKTNTEFYEGTVLAIGETVKTELEQCPELEIGDKVIFNQFAGAVAATEDCYTKVITGHDVVAIFNGEDIKPTNDRILVEILNENFSENGLVFEGSLDPREKETQRCKVLKCGPNSKNINIGETVFIDPYCGNLIVNTPELKLKTVNYFDILYKI